MPHFIIPKKRAFQKKRAAKISGLQLFFLGFLGF